MTGPAPRSAAPDSELVERFKAALGWLWPEGGKLGLAVSGGPDSMALLLLAEAAIPGRFEVATVDHRLRPESAGECEMVARVCAERGVPCQVLAVTVSGGNRQSMARDARYGALAPWAEDRGLSAVATGHHADDQAETLLMRLNRGSGVSGLAGVREVGTMPSSLVPTIRPLLRFRRAELAKLLADAGLVPVNDPSNSDDRYDRARVRKAIAEWDWLDPLALTASAAHLADAHEVIVAYARSELAGNFRATAEQVRYRPSSMRAISMQNVAWALEHWGGNPRGQDVARLIERLEEGRGGNLAGVLATVEGDEWVFRPEPLRRT